MVTNTRPSRTGSRLEPSKSYETGYTDEGRAHSGDAGAEQATTPETTHSSEPLTNDEHSESPTGLSVFEEATGLEFMGTEIHDDHIVAILQTTRRLVLPLSARSAFRRFRSGETVAILFTDDSANPIRVRRLGDIRGKK